MVELHARAPNPKPPETPTVICLGALVPRKGQLALVDAFRSIVETLPRAKLVIAGDGPQRKRLERRISECDLSRNVDLVGAVSSAEKRELLSAAHVACFPSRYGESFGIVLLEAMAAGPAVLAGSNAGYAELLSDVPEALVEPYPEPLARALITLLLDKQRRRRLTVAQQALVQSFDADLVATRIEAVYRSALNRRRSMTNTYAR